MAYDDFTCLYFDRLSLSAAPILNCPPVIVTDLFTRVNTAMLIKDIGNKGKQRSGKHKALRLFIIYQSSFIQLSGEVDTVVVVTSERYHGNTATHCIRLNDIMEGRVQTRPC